MRTFSPLPVGFSISKAHDAQKRLSKRILQEDRLPKKIRLVAGVDVSYFDDKAVGAVVVLDYNSLRLVESRTAIVPAKFPYVPTLLSFREIPPIVACLRRLRLEPNVFLVDGQGVTHPYGLGFASHLGLAIGKPTIGVAKSRLFGKEKEINGETFLVHDDKVIGRVLTTKQGVNPVYVSVGHLVSLETAVKIVLHCTRGGRISEPLRMAHNLATEKKRQMEMLGETLSTLSGNSESTTGCV